LDGYLCGRATLLAPIIRRVVGDEGEQAEELITTGGGRGRALWPAQRLMVR